MSLTLKSLRSIGDTPSISSYQESVNKTEIILPPTTPDPDVTTDILKSDFNMSEAII